MADPQPALVLPALLAQEASLAALVLPALLAREASLAASLLLEASLAASLQHQQLEEQQELVPVRGQPRERQQATELERPDSTQESRAAAERPEERAYLDPSRLRTKKWALHLKPEPVPPQASRRATTTLFRGPADTCRVPMLEMDCRLLPLLPQRAEPIRPRPFARLSPKAHWQSTSPRRHLRSRRIAVREASPSGRPSPASYDRRFRGNPGSLGGHAPTDRARLTIFSGQPTPRPRRKNTAISSNFAAHRSRPTPANGTQSAGTSDEPTPFLVHGRIIGGEFAGLEPDSSPRAWFFLITPPRTNHPLETSMSPGASRLRDQ